MRSPQGPIGGLLYDIRRGLAGFGRLAGKAYELLWKATTGRPYTHIMRDHPWYYVIPAVIMMIAMAWARRRYKGWVIGLAVAVAASLGFIAGHVFW